MDRDRGSVLALGAGIGAALMYFFDADRGRRRRALVRDRVSHGLSRATDAMGTTRRDVVNRAHGLTARARSRFSSGEAIDDVLIARVRTELGRIVSHPKAIEVYAKDGTITLRGAIVASEVERAIAGARRARGVHDVVDEMRVYRSAHGVPALQGGHTHERRRLESLQASWTPAARLLGSVAGGALVLTGTRVRGRAGAALGLAGAGLLARSLGRARSARLAGAGAGRRGIDVQKTITVNAPVNRVFAFWNRYENFPRFLSHVREVRDLGGGRSHWVVDGPAGMPVEWDAEVTRLIPDRCVAWKSVDGSAIAQVGTVRFDPNDDGTTRIDVKMSYKPPGGMVGHGVAALLGSDPKRQIDDDLARLKMLLETGPSRLGAEAGAGVRGGTGAVGPEARTEAPGL